MKHAIVAIVLALSFQTAFAEEKKTPGIHLNGFLQLDLFHDSTRSLTEIPGNTPIELDTTASGANGRTQMSARASRVRLTADGPSAGAWQTQGVAEIDFFGAQPSPISEHNFFSAGLPRIRHMAFFVTKEHWEILVGQFWSLYGLLDGYLPTTVAFRPPVGSMLARTPQIRVTNEFLDSSALKATWAAALSQPTQRDSEIPNLDFAARLNFKNWKGTWAIPFRLAASHPAQLAVSGTLRGISVPSAINSSKLQLGHGVALSAMLPLLPAADLGSSSLVWTAEIATGQAVADLYPGMTGNIPALTHNATTPNHPNVDAGLGGMRADTGAFEMMKIFSANTTLQFHLPSEWRTLFNLYYGIINSSNASQFTVPAGTNIYTQMHSMAANVFHNFADNIRGGVEYTVTKTNYASSQSATNHRIQVSGWFTF